jgi:Polyketide cyclase / dehydrase and lipid transport
VIGRLFSVGVLAATARCAYGLLVRGRLTLDLGIGRSIRPLGPLAIQIAAPRDVVFDVISGPYLGRTPRALADRLQVLERGEDMVVAAHFTQVGRRVATTVETVRFERPSRIQFRLVRGPVPHVVEEFVLAETAGGTELGYRGELGVDLWALGRLWGARVARRWEAAVRESLAATAAEAERRAQRR